LKRVFPSEKNSGAASAGSEESYAPSELVQQHRVTTQLIQPSRLTAGFIHSSQVRPSITVIGLALSVGTLSFLPNFRGSAFAAESVPAQFISFDAIQKLPETLELSSSDVVAAEQETLVQTLSIPQSTETAASLPQPTSVEMSTIQISRGHSSSADADVWSDDVEVSNLERQVEHSAADVRSVLASESDQRSTSVSVNVDSESKSSTLLNLEVGHELLTSTPLATSPLSFTQLMSLQLGDALFQPNRVQGEGMTVEVNPLLAPQLKDISFNGPQSDLSASLYAKAPREWAHEYVEAMSAEYSLPTQVASKALVVQSSSSSMPIASVFHQVRAGETLQDIASTYKVSESTLVRLNQIEDPDMIQTSEFIKVPHATVGQSAVHLEPSSTQLHGYTPTAVAKPTPNGISAEANTHSTSNLNPYMQQIQAEVQHMQTLYRKSGGELVTQLEPTPMPLARTHGVQPALAGIGGMTDVPTTPPTTQPVIATATPASSNHSTSEGRQVSPDLPPLSSADTYLPAPNQLKGYIWPTKGVMTSGYGWRWGRMHRGIDIAAPIGTPVYATASGVIESSGWNSGGYGYLVDIRHSDGSLSRYAHNSRLLVHEGQQVDQGQQIAEMGSTGRSTGPHLHFEIHASGHPVNPMALLPKSRSDQS
jgi:murein DD-endopeptidase MepM/ murein hydrolase activator NlpD